MASAATISVASMEALSTLFENFTHDYKYNNGVSSNSYDLMHSVCSYIHLKFEFLESAAQRMLLASSFHSSLV